MLSRREVYWLMNSAEIALSLVDKTEANLKRIDAFGDDFVAPSLNEWRYTARHLIRAIGAKDPEKEWQCAIGHLKRAYFDSCDIILDCQLKVLQETTLRYKGYAGQVVAVIPEYPKFMERIREAQSMHARVGMESVDRDAFYDKLDPFIVDLQAIIEKLAANADEIEMSVRRAKVMYHLAVCAAAATIVGFLFGLGGKLCKMLFS